MSRRLLLMSLLVLATSVASCVSEEFQSPEGVGWDRDAARAYKAGRAGAPTAGAPTSRSLVELLECVDAGSTDLAQVRAQVAQAVADVDAAVARLRPNLSIEANLLAYARVPGRGFGFESDARTLDISVAFSIPLDLSGTLKESARAAQARYRAARTHADATAREQRFLAAAAYFSLLEALELRGVNASSVVAQERELKDARSRLAAGMLRKNDVLTVEVTLSQTRQRAVEIESTILQARRALNLAVGLAVDDPTEVAPWPELIPVPADVVAILDRARYENPEVDVLVETRQALLHELDAAQRASAPDVSIGPRFTATTDSSILPASNAVGFLSVAWNPDFNGALAARAGSAEARLVESNWAITGLLRKLENHVLTAHRTAVERQAALHAAETSVGSARENLRILEEQLRVGLTTGRELLDGEALLTQQEAVLRTARHQANRAVFDVAFTAGQDPLQFARELAAPASRPDSRDK